MPESALRRIVKGNAMAGIATEKVGRFTRAQGASSGWESWPIAFILGNVIWLFVIGWGSGFRGWCYFWGGSFLLQLLTMQGTLDAQMTWYFCMSLKLGPSVARNASIGFAECVRPGGSPTKDHCLNLYGFPPIVTSVLFSVTTIGVLGLGPFTSLVRVFYPEHAEGVNKGRYLRLYFFFLRHPLAVQGEGPSNGDGLASMCASETLVYPFTRRGLHPGPPEKDYWLEGVPGSEGKPRIRDMFHDKVFCHRFFRSHNAPCPILCAEVESHRRVKVYLEAEETKVSPETGKPMKLIWKPRYSTMGLGVEHFSGWEGEDAQDLEGVWMDPSFDGWAPSADPYVVEEMIESTEYDHAEWYRCTTLWAYDEDKPKPGYIWRMRNPRGDKRVQTDILGGAYCVTKEYQPYIGPKEGGYSFNPRTGERKKLDKKVEAALTKGIALMRKMHTNLGKELYSIGWDVLIRDSTPYFIEFNINNGFFVADHSVEECEQMHAFFHREFNARLRKQLVDHDPLVDPSGGSEEGISLARDILRKVNRKLVPYNKLSALTHAYDKMNERYASYRYEKLVNSEVEQDD